MRLPLSVHSNNATRINDLAHEIVSTSFEHSDEAVIVSATNDLIRATYPDFTSRDCQCVRETIANILARA